MNDMEINVRTNGIAPDNIVAEWSSKVNGGSGGRSVSLYGSGKNEIRSRQQLLEQAKAIRDELNSAIEDMLTELVAAIRRDQ